MASWRCPKASTKSLQCKCCNRSRCSNRLWNEENLSSCFAKIFLTHERLLLRSGKFSRKPSTTIGITAFTFRFIANQHFLIKDFCTAKSLRSCILQRNIFTARQLHYRWLSRTRPRTALPNAWRPDHVCFDSEKLQSAQKANLDLLQQISGKVFESVEQLSQLQFRRYAHLAANSSTACVSCCRFVILRPLQNYKRPSRSRPLRQSACLSSIVRYTTWSPALRRTLPSLPSAKLRPEPSTCGNWLKLSPRMRPQAQSQR